MRLAVFGATGGTGRRLLEQAAHRGDEVTSLTQTSSGSDVIPGTL